MLGMQQHLKHTHTRSDYQENVEAEEEEKLKNKQADMQSTASRKVHKGRKQTWPKRDKPTGKAEKLKKVKKQANQQRHKKTSQPI